MRSCTWAHCICDWLAGLLGSAAMGVSPAPLHPLPFGQAVRLLSLVVVVVFVGWLAAKPSPSSRSRVLPATACCFHITIPVLAVFSSRALACWHSRWEARWWRARVAPHMASVFFAARSCFFGRDAIGCACVAIVLRQMTAGRAAGSNNRRSGPTNDCERGGVRELLPSRSPRLR